MQKMHMFNNPEFGEVRAIDINGEAWFCLGDVCKVLDLRQGDVVRRLEDGVVSTQPIVDKLKRTQKANFVNEDGLYDVILDSRKPSARKFRKWITSEVLPSLRKAAGLEAWEAFRLMDKERQKRCMDIIHGFKEPTKINYIKANTIADKAVSIKYGLPKMIKKADMTPDMLIDRQKILDSTVSLMRVNDEFNLGLSVSTAVYGKEETRRMF